VDEVPINWKPMKWRIIIRMSFNDDKGSKLRYRVAESLNDCGIKFNAKSSTWEGPAVSPQEAAKQFHNVFTLLSDPKLKGIRRGSLDHLWIYIDHAD
jgi:hypothetical protein